MSEFWDTGATISALRGENFRAFSLFGPVHLFWLSLCGLLSVLLARCYRDAPADRRRKILWTLTILMLADEAGKDIMTLSTGQWSWDYLPLQLCSLNIFLCLWNTLRPNDTTAELIYALSLPGAAAALLSPTWTMEPTCNFMHLHSETVHILLFLYPVALLAGGFRPNWRRVPQIFLYLACIAVPACIANHFLNTNFLFLNGTDGAAINEFFAGIFGRQFYMVGFVFLVGAAGLLLYLPWEIADCFHRH